MEIKNPTYYPPLSESQICKLFEDIVPRGRRVGLAFRGASEITESGIIKTPAAIEKENKDIVNRPKLVVSVGEEVVDLRTMNYVFVSFQANNYLPDFVFERFGYRLVIIEEHFVSCVVNVKDLNNFKGEIPVTG